VHVSVLEADAAKMRNIYQWLWKNGYASIFRQLKPSPNERPESELIGSEVFWKEVKERNVWKEICKGRQ